MDNNYIEFRKKENIRPLKLSNKEKFYNDLINIEHSWSGRMDANICNTFVMEAEQQLINSIELFEDGYFDCAYYSLRSAVDLSTTMVYLADMPDNDRDTYLVAWKDTKDFPMQGQMVKELSRYGNVFADMLHKLPHFFSDAKQLSAELNKYVHKQGFRHFYISRNHPINQNKDQHSFVEQFEHYLSRCIGVVAVMRLAIDPFPILLMDEEILFRCFDSMTEPYSESFVERYIGKSTITKYKQTDIYKGTYDSFICEEKKNDAVFNVMKHQYIDSKRLDDIFSQIHLLNLEDAISVMLVAACKKIAKVYACGGLLMYFTDRNSNRKVMSWSGVDFQRFSKAQNKINQKYDEAFISVFQYDNEDYYTEHNDLLSPKDVSLINEFIKEKSLYWKTAINLG